MVDQTDHLRVFVLLSKTLFVGRPLQALQFFTCLIVVAFVILIFQQIENDTPTMTSWFLLCFSVSSLGPKFSDSEPMYSWLQTIRSLVQEQ